MLDQGAKKVQNLTKKMLNHPDPVTVDTHFQFIQTLSSEISMRVETNKY